MFLILALCLTILYNYILIYRYGYPDPDYLKRVRDEHATKGITEYKHNEMTYSCSRINLMKAFSLDSIVVLEFVNDNLSLYIKINCSNLYIIDLTRLGGELCNEEIMDRND